MRLNVCVALATLAVGLGLVATGDNTSWSRGYGYDGRLYGDLAQHFPGAVFGDEGVTPPGYGKYTEQRPEGLDAYYVRRILPSAAVYYTLSALSIDRTHGNVIACFGVWNAVLIALAAFVWCLCADRLRLERPLKLLGLIGLLVNFAILKGAFYYPVLTDTFAFALAVMSMYFWLSGRTAALAAVTFLNAFTWPTAVVVGVFLLMFPPGVVKFDRRSLSLAIGRRRASILKVTVAALPSLALFGYLIHLRAIDYQAPEGIPLGGAFPLAAAAAAAFVFAALLFLIPDLEQRQLRDLGRSLVSWRTLLAVGVVGSALVIQAALAGRPGYYDEVQLLRSSVWYSALNPGLFAVAMVGFFGPLLVLAIVEWPRLCRQIHALGPGAILIAAFFIANSLLTESRKSIALLPFIVLFVVLAVRERPLRRWFLPAFAFISLVVSRVWLPIGEFGLQSSSALRDFPAQRYFMSSGLWTSYEMYLVQLAGVVALIAFFIVARAGPGTGGEATVGAVPASGSPP